MGYHRTKMRNKFNIRVSTFIPIFAFTATFQFFLFDHIPRVAQTICGNWLYYRIACYLSLVLAMISLHSSFYK